MRTSSFLPPIILDHAIGRLGQRIALGCGEVGFLVLGKDCQYEDRDVPSAKQINDSCSTALSTSPESKANLSNTTAAWDQNAALRIRSQPIDESRPAPPAKTAFQRRQE